MFQLGDEAFPALRVVDNAPGSNLPVRPSRLVGRTSEVSEARRLLASHRLVTIIAVGGAGKTRLAIAVGEEELHHRSGGVWFVDMSAVISEADVPVAVAHGVGMQLGGGPPSGQVVRYLADQDALVILDNCEHVIDACAEFAEAMLGHRGETVLLATSREALDVEGEQVMHLGSLSTGDSAAEDSPAVRLFVERATAIQPGFGLDDSTAVTVARLCERLDGLPLAIELAAARITVMNPAELLAGLDDRFSLLSGARRRQRQRTLEATLDWSYDLLEVDHQRVLRALGVFVGGFDIDEVAAVVDMSRVAAVDAVESLVAKSLVVGAEGGEVSRFALLETLKAYAEDRLVDAGEARTARDRHLEYFHSLAMAHGRTLWSDVRLGDRLRFDRANLTAAIDWAARSDQWVRAGEVLLGTIAVYEMHGHEAEARELFERCERPISAVDPLLADQLRVSMLFPVGMLDDLATIVRCSRQLFDSDLAACRTFGLGWFAILCAIEESARADRYLEQASDQVALAHDEQPGLNADIAHQWLQFTTAFTLGLRGEFKAALDACGEAPDTLIAHDHQGIPGIALQVQSALYLLLLGEPEQALDRLADVDASAQPWNRSFTASQITGMRALVHLGLGDRNEAQSQIRAHALEAATGRIPRLGGDALVILAALAEAEQDNQTAIRLLLNSGVPKSQEMVQVANELARRLGVVQEHAAQLRAAIHDDSWTHGGTIGAEAALRELRTEITRRNWN